MLNTQADQSDLQPERGLWLLAPTLIGDYAVIHLVEMTSLPRQRTGSSQPLPRKVPMLICWHKRKHKDAIDMESSRTKRGIHSSSCLCCTENIKCCRNCQTKHSTQVQGGDPWTWAVWSVYASTLWWHNLWSKLLLVFVSSWDMAHTIKAAQAIKQCQPVSLTHSTSSDYSHKLHHQKLTVPKQLALETVPFLHAELSSATATNTVHLTETNHKMATGR